MSLANTVISSLDGLQSTLAQVRDWLVHTVVSIGLPAVFVVLAMESTGLPVPGETMLILAGVLAGQGKFSLWEVIAVGACATIIGDNVGYWVGRSGGRPFIDRIGHRIFLPPQRLDRAEAFFERRGGPAVALARFFPGLRVAGAFAAGTSRMHWRTFLLWNCLGGVVWVTLVATAGYLLGPAYKTAEKYFGIVGATVVAVAVIAAVVVIMIARHRQEEEIEEEFIEHDDGATNA